MTSLYDLTVRLNANVSGFTSAIALAVGSLRNIQGEAGRAEGAVQRALAQRTQSYTSLQRATTSLDSAQIRHTQSVDAHTRAVQRATQATAQFQSAQDRYQRAQRTYTLASGYYGAGSPEAVAATITRDTAREQYFQAGGRLAQAQSAAQSATERLAISHNTLSNAQLSQAAAANRAANANAAYTAAAQREARMQTGYNQLALGGLETGLGLGIWKVLGGTLRNAMTFQTVQTDIGVGLTDARGRRLSRSQNAATLAALQNQEISIGLKNQMSMTDVARIVDAAVHSGMTRTDVLLGTKGQAGILPGLANFAEVLKMTRGYSPTASATTAAQFAHLFGAWAPSRFNQMTNLLGRALFVSPASPQEFLTLISQFAGTTRALYGKSPADQQRFLTDTMRSGLLLTELGQETRGGTQFAQLIARTMGVRTARNRTQLAGLQAIRRAAGGIDFFDAQGRFKGVPSLVQALYTAYQSESPRQFGAQAYEAFGAVGNRIAGLLGQQSSSDRLKVLTQMLSSLGLPTLPSIQRQFNQTPAGQINQLNSNLNTLSTVVGTQLLPSLTPFIAGLTGAANMLVEFARAHPTIVRLTGQFAALSGSLLLVVGPLTLAAGVFNILFGAGGNLLTLGRVLKTVIPPLAAAVTSAGISGIAAFIGIVGAFGIALYGLYKTVKFVWDMFHSTWGAPNVGATTKVGKTTYGRDTVMGDPRYGSWIPITKPPPGYHWDAKTQQFVPSRPTPPRDPRGRTYGVGGGTRVVPPIVQNFYGVDHETHKGFIQSLTDATVAAINKASDFDENYDGLGIHSLAPGPMGY